MGTSKGRFIVFEGIDGSGKSTQIQNVSRLLAERGVNVYTTFEPTDGPVGKLIRQMLTGKVKVDQRTIASLFAADRTDHLTHEINGMKKKVDQGEIVLCDRYYFSSYAYHAQHVDLEWVIQANALNARMLRPDVTVFIDVDPAVCFERIQKSRSDLEMYEKIDIMTKVRQNYFNAFDRLKDEENVVIIDGNFLPEKVEKSIIDAIIQII